jgi:hypothetical protein
MVVNVPKYDLAVLADSDVSTVREVVDDPDLVT